MAVRVLVLLCLLTAGCASAGSRSAPPEDGAAVPDTASTGEPSGLQPSEGFAVSDVVFAHGSTRIEMPVLVAETATARATGLMFRRSLPSDAGMLFVFDQPDRGAFWMMNVTIPLSIAFVGQDGTVQQIMDMEPCAAEPCARYQPDAVYLYAVEANQGYFAARGITPGWTMARSDGVGGDR